jgi:hypothetical protein
MRIQDHLLLPCRSVLYESGRLFACVALTPNVMNSLFYSASESVYMNHNVPNLSNFFEFSVNSCHCLASSTPRQNG